MWKNVQNNSNEILCSGISNLLNQNKYKFNQIKNTNGGVYLISDREIYLYIGQSNNIAQRIKQHKKYKYNLFQYISTEIGKKELEEFGIVNLNTLDNKSHRNEKLYYKLNCKTDLWNKIQKNSKIILESGEKVFFERKFFKWNDIYINIENKAGVYCIENDKKDLLYIGESIDLKNRFKIHSKRTYFSAFRRSLGEKLFNFKLLIKNNKKRYFPIEQDEKISDYIYNNCRIRFTYVNFGRLELEKFLINKYKPLLNKKFS